MDRVTSGQREGAGTHTLDNDPPASRSDHVPGDLWMKDIDDDQMTWIVTNIIYPAWNGGCSEEEFERKMLVLGGTPPSRIKRHRIDWCRRWAACGMPRVT